ncbi:MAG TPA: glycoside hydrolase family 3 N-terminal domain-containing protein [Oscillospiraceae bacterium]|mgnify:CR=1 FL=1|nr:glycoside hydrolase family 3 N-terminal domain-containing protein [Oscillospiraceae bacterium]
MLSINWDDVINALNLCVPYFIFFGVVLLAAIITMVVAKKFSKSKKYFIRWQSGVAIIAALAIAVNLICFGPMSTIISLATGNGVISEETTVEAQALCEDIADEGIVLLENKDNVLPLGGEKKLNVFGWASTNPCYGGTGSGALSDSYPIVSLLEGLKNAGITTNADLSSFYTSYRADRPLVELYQQDWTLPEPPAASYSSDLINNAKSFSDTAMIVITRVGGEGADLPTDMSKVTYNNNSKDYADFEAGEHYLQLSRTEKDMVDLVCKNFDNVILVYNGANAFELGFVKDYSQIKSVIWCPGTGQNGFNSLGQIITGEVNPSGRTSDTFVSDLTATPYYNNIGNFVYDNMKEFKGLIRDRETTPTFVNYVEGIYVGYRFYETAAEEGLINYDDVVLYPFGYGLSYTTFSQKMGDIKKDNGKITFDVTVTNTGSVAGKDVVEVYYNPPYTNGGIEKASANLVAFEKTDMLEPGASQTITISFNEEDMASFDTYGSKSYVLEAGDYKISIRSDSHNVIEEKTYNVASTVVYGKENPRSTDQVAAVSQFSDAEGHVKYLSRKDGFANYKEATAAPASLTMADDLKAKFINNSNYKPENYNNANDAMPVTGAKNGVKLADLRGKGYDDALWDKLLDELTVDDMKGLIAIGGYQTTQVKSIAKVATVDCDGPASINNNFTGVGSIGFPSAVMIASTWNKNLAKEFGESIGKMADEMGVSGWYAPGMNMHRSAFAGRNFEYYSEDGLLAGKMAANAVAGAKENGVYAYIKHFALNDQEMNRRDMLCTWSNEQAIREIYLKPFELAVKEGGANAVMSAYNYIGPVWAGGTSALLKAVLREEWGFRGFVLTDYFRADGCGYKNADQGIRNGNDACLTTMDSNTNYVKDTSATSVIAMREAAKNILYTVVNSRAYASDNINVGLLNWQITAIVIDVVIVAALAALEILVIIKGYKKRKAAE